jgi:aminoglycoside N3'-acetyltransferase
MALITRQSLAQDYKNIGLKSGDIVLMRASMGAIGRTEFKDRQTHIDAIFDVIGDKGTLVGLSFSKSFFTPFVPPKNFIFNDSTPTITGGFVKTLLSHPDRVRSKHPTNSFVAIGAQANELMDGHDANAHTYFPMEKLLQHNAKMILVGCCDDSPGFTTAHLAEYNLGYLKNILFPSLHRVYYQDGNNVKLYKRTELGSDSFTFSKYYDHYRANDVLNEGTIGNAQSMIISCKDAYTIEYNILKENPRFHICDRDNCKLCCGRHWLNKRAWFKFYWKIATKKLFI